MTSDKKEYDRQYYLANRDKKLARDCERSRAKSNYMNGELDPNSKVGRGFISEMVVAKTLYLDNDARCNCTAHFGFAYDLYDDSKYYEIDVKSSKIRARNCWQFNFKNKYTPDTYILVAYSEDYTTIEHVWIIPTHVNIVLNKMALAVYNTIKGLNRVREFEVDNTMYNIWLHTMSINNCQVLKKPDHISNIGV